MYKVFDFAYLALIFAVCYIYNSITITSVVIFHLCQWLLFFSYLHSHSITYFLLFSVHKKLLLQCICTHNCVQC